MNYRVVLFPLWVEANLEWCLLVSSETLDWYFFWYVAYNAFIFFRFFFFLGRTLNFNWVIYTVDHRKELLHAFHYVMIDLSMHGTLFKQQSTSKELQKETMFLGVSLMDRFLSKDSKTRGSFKLLEWPVSHWPQESKKTNPSIGNILHFIFPSSFSFLSLISSF